MQKLILLPKKRRCQYCAAFLVGNMVYDVYLNLQNDEFPSICVWEEEVVDTCEIRSGCFHYVDPDGRKIRAQLRVVRRRVRIPSWETFLEQPETVLVRLRL